MAAKKVMMVLPPMQFDVTVYRTLRQALRSRGYQVAVTSVVTRGVTASDGSAEPVDIRMSEIQSYQYDAFVFIGGPGARALYEDAQVIKLVGDCKFKTVAATGDAVALLALAEALKGKKATAPVALAPLLDANGAVFTNEVYQIDDKVLTLKESAAAPQFADALAQAIA